MRHEHKIHGKPYGTSHGIIYGRSSRYVRMSIGQRMEHILWYSPYRTTCTLCFRLIITFEICPIEEKNGVGRDITKVKGIEYRRKKTAEYYSCTKLKSCMGGHQNGNPI